MHQTFDFVQTFVDKAFVRMKMRQYQTTKLCPRVPFSFQSGHYEVKTADSNQELDEILRLRYEVFFREGLNKKAPVRVDLDSYDFICDHLIIKDIRTAKVVGTYRLISSLFSSKFYSQSEFILDTFLSLPGNKLELGRACVSKNYRNGAVLTLLWRGVVQYLRITDSKYLFGCASVPLTHPKDIAKLTKYLCDTKVLEENLLIEPQGEYRLQVLRAEIEKLQNEASIQALNNELAVDDDLSSFIPPLLQAYMRAGAKVYGLPAFDREFQCVDYFTILDTANLSKVFERKYRPHSLLRPEFVGTRYD